MICRFLPMTLLACLVSMARALPDSTYDIPGKRLDQAPKIDGVIQPGEYPEEIHRSGFRDKDTNLESDELGEFWIGYDERYIYFAGRATTNPRKVVRDEYRPNVGMGGNDNFGLIIDPFGGNSNFNLFQTNANGATSINLAGGRAAKTEWLGEIEANGRLTETGWECEMRIPWSVMSLPPEGIRSPRFNITWYRSAKSNTYAYRFTGQNNELTPAWVDVEVPKVDRGRSVSFLPYAYGGIQKGAGPIANAGLDFKTSLTDSIQFVGTLNPDFRNVESSILSLDFSYFERLASENRPFFNEGSQFLRVGYSTRLFAPQRIPTFDAGFNIYGQANSKLTFGALSTIDFGERTATVASANYRFDDKTSAEIGIVNNSRHGQNSTAGLANIFTRTGDVGYFFTNQYTTDQTRGAGFRNNIGVTYNKGGYNGSIEYLSITPDFFPRIGFNRESDLKGYSMDLSHEATPAHGNWNSYSFGVDAVTYDRYSGGFYRNEANFSVQASDRKGFSFGASTGFSQFLGIADRTFGVGAAYPYNNPYRAVAANYESGTFLGNPYEAYDVSAVYRVFGRLQFSLKSQWQLSDDDETLHILGANFDIGKFESVGGRLVVQNGQSNWYLSYRMSGKRGAEYFILVGDPRADSFTNRLVIKAVIPFSVKY
ncbi:MAG: hypothetical protein JSS71_03330 [Armatimonadetes bacterium]|nr:hypothetical protein [Armatimonadota bacterium]MBX3108413.1 hypothetical protein [Fimbriimonadaceae bacterium]